MKNLPGPRGLLAKSDLQQVCTSIAEDTFLEFILPIVIMGEATERGLNTAEHDRDVGEELLEDL